VSDEAAEEWFLPRSERPWSAGNLVTPLVHGRVYYERLLDVISATHGGDSIYFTDWRGDADEELTDAGPTVVEALTAAASRGVKVRALLWRSHSDRVSFSEQENEKLGERINEAGGVALLDQRVRRGGSHHQKMLVVRHAANPEADVAFVGGIDLCHSRRDDSTHAGDQQAQKIDKRYGKRPPWHDAMVEIRGPAVVDVLDTFIQRWNDPTPVDHNNPYRRMLQKKARMPRHAPPLGDDGPRPSSAGTHRVQLLRTYAAKRPPFPFAVRGERTIARAYEHAFARAKRLIYIEDQYLWSDVVARTLAEALRRTPTLQVIAVVPRYPDQDGLFSGPPNRLGQISALDVLAAAGGDRFAAYDLENDAGTPIYVHAKVCVVDDIWMTCGSDNFNRRSWTHDAELTCAVIDESLPQQLRSSLWAEHLGIPVDDPRLADLDGAGQLWRDRATVAGCRAKPHEPAPVSRLNRLWATPMYRLVYDPDGRPRSMRRRGSF
jgi:phosphatidylserine/phosphatidylglycerophosphate/cardiolipin synthase-like enzyme